MLNTNNSRLNPAFNSLQGLSVGDAFGEKFFLHPDVAENMIASRAIPAMPWYYTDDTQMALSIRSFDDTIFETQRSAKVNAEERGGMKSDVERLIQISRYRGLCSDEEKILIEYLRSINEDEAVEVLKYMVDQKSLISTKFAKRVLSSKIHVKRFFEYGVINSDAQSIKQWLDFVIPKLGFKSTVYLIEKLNNKDNRLMDKAVYWLTTFIPENDPNSYKIINKLKDKIKSRRVN